MVYRVTALSQLLSHTHITKLLKTKHETQLTGWPQANTKASWKGKKQAHKSVLHNGEWSKGILQEGLVACKAARTQRQPPLRHHSQLAWLDGSCSLGAATLLVAAAARRACVKA